FPPLFRRRSRACIRAARVNPLRPIKGSERMLGKFGLAVAAVLISAAPAMAAGVCGGAPIAPAAVDGSKVTEAQMKDAHDDVVNFIKASDDYQSCVIGDLDRQRRVAARDGARDLSLRAVAAEAGYAPAALYGYFANKDELLLALAAEDLSGLARAMRDAG